MDFFSASKIPLRQLYVQMLDRKLNRQYEKSRFFLSE